MMVTFRPAKSEDFEQLPALYSRVLQKKVSATEIQWRFRQNPFLNGKIWNYAAVDEQGILIAHSAYIPMQYGFNGKIYIGALSAGSMVQKEYGGLFAKLYTELEKDITAQKVDFLFAFPNPQSFPFFVKLFGFKQKYFTYLSVNLDNLKFLPGNEEKIDCNAIHNSFNRNFLDWRIKSHPVFTYEQNTDYICKPFGEDELDIVALIPESLKNKKEKGGFSLNSDESFNQIKRKKKYKMAHIYSTDQSFTSELKKRGFQEQPVPNKLTVKILNPELAGKPFFLQMADSDVF